MPTPHVEFEQTGALAFLTFSRPEARNAMTWEMYEALVDYCDRVDGSSDINIGYTMKADMIEPYKEKKNDKISSKTNQNGGTS